LQGCSGDESPWRPGHDFVLSDQLHQEIRGAGILVFIPDGTGTGQGGRPDGIAGR